MKFAVRLLVLFLACVSAAEQNGAPSAERASAHGTPAYRAAKQFMRGANFANFLEVPPGQGWAVHHTVADLKFVRAEGFDHIRLPVGWHHYTGPAPEFKLSDDIFGKVDDIVSNATALGLSVIINIHHFNEFTSNPPAYTDQFCAIWRQVAAHYASAPPGVAFELLNEPKDAATTVVINPIYAQAIAVIRQTNPRRTIFAGPGRWNSPSELVNFRLPENDDNIIVTLHCYEPFHFTHQGANWAGPDQRVTGIQFPGPPKEPLVPDPDLRLSPGTLNWIRRYNTLPAGTNPSSPQAFGGLVEKAKAWSRQSGRPIHFGEFGAYTKADPQSRAHFYAAFRQAMDDAGMGWAIWDWKSGFNYWDPKTHQPLPGMRRALFPNSIGTDP
jgi:endoglucanase